MKYFIKIYKGAANFIIYIVYKNKHKDYELTRNISRRPYHII